TLDGAGVRLRIEGFDALAPAADQNGRAEPDPGTASSKPDPGTAPEPAMGRPAPAVPLDEVKAVWFRRWLGLRRHEMAELLDAPRPPDAPAAGPPPPAGPPLDYLLRRHLTLESRKLSDFLFARLADRPWLSH